MPFDRMTQKRPRNLVGYFISVEIDLFLFVLGTFLILQFISRINDSDNILTLGALN